MLNTRKQIYAECALSVQNLAKLFVNSERPVFNLILHSLHYSLPLLKQIRFELLMREFHYTV